MSWPHGESKEREKCGDEAATDDHSCKAAGAGVPDDGVTASHEQSGYDFCSVGGGAAPWRLTNLRYVFSDNLKLY